MRSSVRMSLTIEMQAPLSFKLRRYSIVLVFEFATNISMVFLVLLRVDLVFHLSIRV